MGLTTIRDAALAAVNHWALTDGKDDPRSNDGNDPLFDRLMSELCKALAAPEPKQEPVGDDTIQRLRQLAFDVLSDRLYILGSGQWADPELVARWNAEVTPAKILQLTRDHPAPEPTQEPVAWMHDNQAFRSIDGARYDQERQERCGCKRKPIIPLYDHPAPQQTPMTEEQITEAWVNHGMNVMTFARAVERYHGIGEQ